MKNKLNKEVFVVVINDYDGRYGNPTTTKILNKEEICDLIKARGLDCILHTYKLGEEIKFGVDNYNN